MHRTMPQLSLKSQSASFSINHFIRIDNENDIVILYSPKEDYEMLSDMIVAASKEACKQIDKTTAQKMEKYSALTGGLGGFF